MIRIEKLKFTVFSVSVLFVFAVFLGAVVIALEDEQVQFVDALIVGAVMTAALVFLIEIGGRVYRRVFSGK